MTTEELIQVLRDLRPDPFTVKVSFLRGWDAATAELERRLDAVPEPPQVV